jgi:hypothetical protein
MASLKYNTRLVFGNTSHGPSGLICELTALVSNKLVMRISSTSFLHYALKRMKLLRIGMVVYCGINLDWNYGKRWVGIAMPIYAIKNLTRYNHPPPLKPQHCPYMPNPITYGKDNQATTLSNTSPLLDVVGKKRI